MERLKELKGRYYCLSNFGNYPVCYKGILYKNSEAAFHAQKVFDPLVQAQFSQLSPDAAKRLGRQVYLRPDWDDVRVQIMEEIVRAKIEQNYTVRNRLLETGDAYIEEGNTWHDTFWGVDLKTGKGENNLGKILMKIRKELRDDQDC